MPAAPSFPLPGQRIAVVGVTGTGKTTLATRLADILAVPHVELDALNWQPGWQALPPEVFRQRVDRALQGRAWVTDGNYSQVRDIIWKRADTLVWLDLPFPQSFWRLTTRSLRRLLLRETLWNNNRETFKDLFLSRDSLFIYIFTSYRKHHSLYPLLLQSPEFAHLRLVRIRSQRQLEAWLARVKNYQG